MKKLTIALFLALTGCAFDAAETGLPPFELADEVTGTIGAESRRPPPPLAHADSLPSFQLGSQTDSHTCLPGVFVGCSDDNTTAVFCGDDGRSLEKEACENGCGAAACIDSDRNPEPSALTAN